MGAVIVHRITPHLFRLLRAAVFRCAAHSPFASGSPSAVYRWSAYKHIQMRKLIYIKEEKMDGKTTGSQVRWMIYSQTENSYKNNPASLTTLTIQKSEC